MSDNKIGRGGLRGSSNTSSSTQSDKPSVIISVAPQSASRSPSAQKLPLDLSTLSVGTVTGNKMPQSGIILSELQKSGIKVPNALNKPQAANDFQKGIIAEFAKRQDLPFIPQGLRT